MSLRRRRLRRARRKCGSRPGLSLELLEPRELMANANLFAVFEGALAAGNGSQEYEITISSRGFHARGRSVSQADFFRPDNRSFERSGFP